MRVMAVCVMLAMVGCKKHETPAATGSAGSAGSGSGSGSAVVAAPPPPIVIDAAPSPTTGDKLGSNVMDKETIGGVALGDDADKITKALGAPTKKGKASMEEATGATVASWEYGTSVLTVAKVDGKWIAFSFRVDAPSDWKTSKGIHIGSTKAEVDAAYDGETQDDGVLVGTPYGGELFTLKDGKVSEIFLGAMAE